MPTYCHICNECQHEWEDFYGINTDPPTVCPECKTEGKVERLISGGAGRGIIRLYGKELEAKIKSDANKLKRDAGKNEKLLANLVGEDKYQGNEVLRQKLKERNKG